MAMDNTLPRVLPKFSLVSSYSVQRIGKYPSVTVRFQECNYLLTNALVVTAPTDTNADGLYEQITVQDVTTLGITNPVGHMLSDLNSNMIATVTASEQVEVIPAGQDGAGVPTPAQYRTLLTLSTGVSDAQIAGSLALVQRMPVGTTAYAPVNGAGQWEINLFGANAQAMQEMGNLLGGAYFASAKAVLAKLGLTVTDADLMTAIQALAAEGSNLDGFLAQQGEALESKRRAGQLPFAMVSGL